MKDDTEEKKEKGKGGGPLDEKWVTRHSMTTRHSGPSLGPSLGQSLGTCSTRHWVA